MRLTRSWIKWEISNFDRYFTNALKTCLYGFQGSLLIEYGVNYALSVMPFIGELLLKGS